MFSKNQQTDALRLLPQLRALAVFRGLRQDPVLQALDACLTCALQANLGADGTPDLLARVTGCETYATLAARLYEAGPIPGGTSLAEHLCTLVTESDNAYIRAAGRKADCGAEPARELTAAMEHELETLQRIADLTPQALQAALGFKDSDSAAFLPLFPVRRVDIAARYRERIADVHRCGYGMYARYTMFYLDGAGQIVPVRHPDAIRLEDLVAYDRERQLLLENTRALLAGKPAANVLLTGDAGTGKSSGVKAVANELAPEGLRILELRKEQLTALPDVLDTLSENPLKFILFIDDLSFQRDDDRYSALKAALEGSVSAKSRNVVIYATSNRSHIVKEQFSDREGDDIHRNDTMQEQISLSERFGLHIVYRRPDRALYLRIVRGLLARAAADDAPASTSGGTPASTSGEVPLPTPGEALDRAAERFALEHGGRSARTARQFADLVLSGVLDPARF